MHLEVEVIGDANGVAINGRSQWYNKSKRKSMVDNIYCCSILGLKQVTVDVLAAGY
jgi:hypothetical protein